MEILACMPSGENKVVASLTLYILWASDRQLTRFRGRFSSLVSDYYLFILVHYIDMFIHFIIYIHYSLYVIFFMLYGKYLLLIFLQLNYFCRLVWVSS